MVPCAVLPHRVAIRRGVCSPVGTERTSRDAKPPARVTGEAMRRGRSCLIVSRTVRLVGTEANTQASVRVPAVPAASRSMPSANCWRSRVIPAPFASHTKCGGHLLLLQLRQVVPLHRDGFGIGYERAGGVLAPPSWRSSARGRRSRMGVCSTHRSTGAATSRRSPRCLPRMTGVNQKRLNPITSANSPFGVFGEMHRKPPARTKGVGHAGGPTRWCPGCWDPGPRRTSHRALFASRRYPRPAVPCRDEGQEPPGAC